jgi:GGDEF domain-containing protein
MSNETALGQRLAEISRMHENAYRVWGDEFVLIWEDLDRVEMAEVVAKRFKQALSQPIESSIGAIQLGATIGIATTSSSRVRPDEHLAKAGENMYPLRRPDGSDVRKRFSSRSATN